MLRSERPEMESKEAGFACSCARPELGAIVLCAITGPGPRIGDLVALGLVIGASSLITIVDAALFLRALVLTAPEYVVTAGSYFALFSALWVIRLRRMRLSFGWYVLTYGLTSIAFGLSLAILVFVLYLGPNL